MSPRSNFRLRFIGRVDRRLRPEILALTRWLRRWYLFPSPLELRLVHEARLIDTDGTPCSLRWWQNDAGAPVVVEIAVQTFARNHGTGGPELAFPTVIAAVARALSYYDRAITDRPTREELVERWGDRLLEAYLGSAAPPVASRTNRGLRRVAAR